MSVWWWVVYAVGVAAVAVSEVWLVRAVSVRGVSRRGLVRPPWRAVVLRGAGIAAVLAVAIWSTGSLLWAVVAVWAPWVPWVPAMVLRRRLRGARERA